MEIRFRERTGEVVRTIDRAGLMAGRFRDISMRTKDDPADVSGKDEGAYGYAPDAIRDGAVKVIGYTMRAGAVSIRQKGAEEPDILPETEKESGSILRTFAECDRKSLLNRQGAVHMADDEAMRNAVGYRIDERISWADDIRHEGPVRRGLYGAAKKRQKLQKSGGPIWHEAAGIAKNRQKPPKGLELIQRKQKEYAVKRIRERYAGHAGFWGPASVYGDRLKEKAAGRIGSTLKDIAESAKVFLGSLGIGGAAALLIVVVMVIFGAAFMITEDGNQIVGTGDGAIVEVAKAEIGNEGGDKFWKWYGFRNHVDWCAIFCSWCADQCGYIENGMLPRFSVVGDGAGWFKARHRWSGRGHSPNPGDFIFFDYEQDGVLDHVGIVECCDGKAITTIEGNAGDVCRRLSYGVGSPRIAGYGLMIRPAGNRARQIALKAISLAYPDASDKARYHGGEPTAAYKAALDRAYPDRLGWGKPSRDGASCDVFVGVCLIDSGVDRGFPRTLRKQVQRLDSRKDLYDRIVSTSTRDIHESELKDGDIVTWEKNNGTVHIFIYAGGKARHASLNKWYGRTTSLGNNIRIRGKKVIRVYRVKD